MSIFKKLFGRPEKTPNSEKESTPKSTPDQPEPMTEENSEELTILPRIKVDYSHSIYNDDKTSSFKGNPLPEGMVLPDDQKPIVKELWGDLLLCFAVDIGNSYKLLQQNIMTKNPHLSLEALQQVSINALVAEVGQNIKIHGDPNDILMITAGGNFEAALLLVDGLLDQIHDMIQGDAILAIPARDLLFICNSNNKAGVQKIKEMTKGYFDNPETQGLLSKALYLRKKGVPTLVISDTAF